MRSVDRRQRGLRRADEIGRSRPVGGTSAGIFTGRVLRDGSAICTPATCSVPVGRSSYGTAMTRVKGPCTSVSHADDRGTHAAGARAAPVLVCSNLVLVCSNPPAAGLDLSNLPFDIRVTRVILHSGIVRSICIRRR